MTYQTAEIPYIGTLVPPTTNDDFRGAKSDRLDHVCMSPIEEGGWISINKKSVVRETTKRSCILPVPKSVSLTWMLVPGSFASSGVIATIRRDTTGSCESIVSGTDFSWFRASVTLNDEM